MHLDRIVALRNAADASALCAELIRITNDANFGRVNAMLVTEVASGKTDFACIGNTPEAFTAAFNDPVLGQRDPVMQHVRGHVTPIVYDQNTYVSAGAGELWETQAPFGYRTGIVVSIRLANCLRYAVGIDREEVISVCQETRARMTGEVMLMAAYSADAARKLLGSGHGIAQPVELTPREREILTWTLLGKSSWVVGELIGLDASTVNFHVRNAMRKFGVSSKHVAAVHAFKLGLICP